MLVEIDSDVKKIAHEKVTESMFVFSKSFLNEHSMTERYLRLTTLMGWTNKEGNRVVGFVEIVGDRVCAGYPTVQEAIIAEKRLDKNLEVHAFNTRAEAHWWIKTEIEND